ncbi:MAG: hypothetical protein GX989_07565 [Firmicutes bacterium]|nr:hypothetical protein [Bacillota bacterium]
MAGFTKKSITVCAVLLVICLVLLPSTFSGKAEAGGGIKVKINDKFLSLPQAPVQVGMTTLLPFRPIYEFLGATITWDEKTRTASAFRGDIKVALQVESGVALINDDRIILNVAPRIINGTTMVPTWFFAESLGAEVDWDAEQQVVNISMAAVNGIALEKGALTLGIGEVETIAATVFPENAFNKNIRWRSSSSHIADVQRAGGTEAVILAINPGTAIITATTEDGNYVSTCKVEVEEAYKAVTGVSLNRTKLALWEGEAPWTLVVDITPKTATNKSVTWKSSNTGVASVYKRTVNRGTIVPLKEGETIISVTTEDGEYTAICTVTVYAEDDD